MGLEQIFRQDRFLQNYQVDYKEIDPLSTDELGKAAVLALTIEADPELMERYQRYLTLYQGLTNLFMDYPVTELLPYLIGFESLEDIASVAGPFNADNRNNIFCYPHFALFPASTSKETAYF